MDTLRLQMKADLLGQRAFLGFPAGDFERGGREQFTYLLSAGLHPNAKLVDIGCGVLRAGYWLIHFLNSGRYHGIEPHLGRLEMGTKEILEPGTVESKRPRFDTNARFDTSVFGEKFDFFLAYSIWTHASKRHIQTMLDSFERDASDSGVFLTTFVPSSWRHRDYTGETWVGTSHESDVAGIIYHNRGWIDAECARRGLLVTDLGRDKTYGQTWLELRRNTAKQPARMVYSDTHSSDPDLT